MRVVRTGVLALIVLAACTGRGDEVADERTAVDTAVRERGAARRGTSPCPPLERRPPNAPDQAPAFPGQTRACGIYSKVAFDVVVLASGLEHPWAVEPLPDGGVLVTERPGRMRVVSADGTVGPPIEGVPVVHAERQGGLLDVALSPSFRSDRTIFWSYAEPRNGMNGTTVARGVLSPDGRRLSDVRVIFRAIPSHSNSAHFGSRLAFGPDGMLYVTTGDRYDASMRMNAQRLDNHLGKVLRIAPDGSVPRDNPFVGETGAMPEIWSLVHRNVQSLAFDPEGRLWLVEHGPRGGDELNRIERGKNYGWPLVSFGIEYSGAPIEGAVTDRPGFERPVYSWDPVIAPSGMEWYTGDLFPAWKGSVFMGALEGERLVRLVVRDGLVEGEEHLLADRGKRIRDVRQGPDGALYLVTDEEDGEVWKLVPAR